MEYGVDVGDQQMHQQHQQRQQAAAQDTQARGGAFKQQMGSTPQQGDVVEHGGNRFLVVGGSMEGVQVKQLGNRTGKVISIPHGTKFQAMGQGASGKNVFEIVK